MQREKDQGPGGEGTQSDGRGTEEALRASESRYRALAESSPHGIWHVGRDGRTLYANPVMCRLLEVDAAPALEGRTYHEYFPPGSLEVIRREHVLREAGKGSSYEVELVGALGTRRRVVISGGPILDAAGQFESVIGTFVDVTDLRRQEADRRGIESRIGDAQRMESLGVLAGGIAHDFNNLLTGVLANASLAQEHVEPGSTLAGLLASIERSAERAAELTGQMLAYAGKGRFHLETINLQALVRNMAALLRSSVSKKASIELDTEGTSATFDGDPSQVGQILLTLVQNASDALEDGSGRIRVSTGLMTADAGYFEQCAVPDERAPGPYAYLEVADDGAGMQPETLRRIFEPFFTTKAQGRGLGLAATLGIVRGHRGTIHVQSRPGTGTTFRVLFPASGAATLAWAPAAPKAARSGPATLLVVDDEEMVRQVAMMALGDAGFRVVVASDGLEALDRVRDHGAALDGVVLDMTMPRMGGDEALREIRKVLPEVPVVVCSGYTEEEATAGVDPGRRVIFLQKPFRPRDLVAKVREAMGFAV